MTSFRTRPLDFATEVDFGALGRLPRQDLVHIEPHLLAAASLILARCPIRVPVWNNKIQDILVDRDFKILSLHNKADIRGGVFPTYLGRSLPNFPRLASWGFGLILRQ